MPGVVSYKFLTQTGPIGFTTDGGLYVIYYNNTGSPTVKGTIVVASSTPGGVSVAPANSDACIGVIYDDVIPVSQPVRVVIGGRAQVLLKNGESSTAGYWCGVSDNSGRMYQQSGVPSTSEHNREIGHSLETVAGGTNKLAWVNLHFN